MSDKDENTYAAALRNSIPRSAIVPLPEKIEINGVTYWRSSDNVELAIGKIRSYQIIAEQTGVSLSQAVWLYTYLIHHATDGVMPD